MKKECEYYRKSDINLLLLLMIILKQPVGRKLAAHATIYSLFTTFCRGKISKYTFYHRNVAVYQKSGCRILEGTASGDGVSRDGVTPALLHGNLAVHYHRLISPTF